MVRKLLLAPCQARNSSIAKSAAFLTAECSWRNVKNALIAQLLIGFELFFTGILKLQSHEQRAPRTTGNDYSRHRSLGMAGTRHRAVPHVHHNTRLSRKSLVFTRLHCLSRGSFLTDHNGRTEEDTVSSHWTGAPHSWSCLHCLLSSRCKFI